MTALLDAVRLRPGADVAAVTISQVREVLERLIAAGRGMRATRRSWSCWTPATTRPRIAHLLGDLPVEILGRMRSDRVLRRLIPQRVPGTNGRPPKHGDEFVFANPATWGIEQARPS